jgi:hypothetical protein
MEAATFLQKTQKEKGHETADVIYKTTETRESGYKRYLIREVQEPNPISLTLVVSEPLERY